MKIKLQAGLKKIFEKGRLVKILKLTLLGGFLFLSLLAAVFQLAYRNKIYPGIKIGQELVGNQEVNRALLNLERKIPNPQNQKLIFIYHQQDWEIDLSETNLNYQLEKTLEKAYRLGRTGHPLKDLQTIIQAWFMGLNLEPDYVLNEALLNQKLALIAEGVYIPSIEPEIKIIDQKIQIDPGQEGSKLNQGKIISQIQASLRTFSFETSILPVDQISSQLTKAQIEKTGQRAERLLGQKIIFAHENEQWELNQAELISFLGFDSNYHQEKVASQAAFLASVIDREPQNATFQFQAGRVTEFKPARNGQELDQKQVQKLIFDRLEQMEKGFLPGDLSLEIINLPVVSTLPEISLDKINDLGIKELIGRGESNYQGSIPSRIHNLILASTRLNGVLIPPGETFSFLENLGEVSPATGYQSAFVIKEGKTILDDGGGVCQVSTTFFRAALNTGLPILERHPHSYRVSYYEQGGFGPGMDATIWIPGVDLKIKNDTPAHILIQTQIDKTNKTLAFEFYGTNDDRQITLSKPKIWNQTPPPPDLYQDDPTLPIGTVKQIERANWGAKVSIDWKVTRNGKVLQKRTFYSHYQPWQAVFLRGTGP